MENVLFGLGAPAPESVSSLASQLYRVGYAEDGGYCFRLICVGSEQNDDIQDRYPKVPQVLWPHVEEFIFRRFKDNSRRKIAHPQWDETGHLLWNAAEAAESLDEFRAQIHAG